MKVQSRLALKFATALIFLSTLNLPLATSFAQGTAFNDQRQLNDGTNPANGYYNLTISHFPASLMAGNETLAQAKEIVVGERAPPFKLKDQDDREFSLQEIIKKGPVAVVFIRSIDWCTYCQLQTIQLSESLPEIKASGGQVVVICYDAPEKVKRFTRRRKINVPVLSDVDSKTIDAYAMRALKSVGDQDGSAQHGTFVVDKSGIVRSKPYLTSFEGHAAVDALVSALKEAGK